MNTYDKIELPSSDEAAAHMLPSDLKKFESGEHVAEAFSIAVGNPDETSQPLFTLDQVRAAIEADRKRQGDAAKIVAELVAIIPLSDTLKASASCQDLIDYFKGVIADRKRRGEPVVWLVRDDMLGTWLFRPEKPEQGLWKYVKPLYDTPQPAEPLGQHPDDAAVDTFAAAMKAKLAKKRADGRGNWQMCTSTYLSRLLREHVEKGDPVDVANLAMMLHENGQRIEPVKVPSDAEIDQLAYEHCDDTGASGEQARFTSEQAIIAFARALLARYGNNAGAAHE